MWVYVNEIFDSAAMERSGHVGSLQARGERRILIAMIFGKAITCRA